MNKQIATKSSTLNKNMTNTESLEVNNLKVTNNLIAPIYKTTDVPSKPQNPTQNTWYIEYDVVARVFTYYYYIDGAWRF